VTGKTFQSWNANAPLNNTTTAITNSPTFVDGPGNLSIPNPRWYWCDLNGSGGFTTETISCTATFTPTSGSGYTVIGTITLPIRVYTPTYTAIGTGGIMEVSTTSPGGNGIDFFFWAGPNPANNGTGGMTWNASCAGIPGTPFTSPGNLQLVQILATENVSITTTQNDIYNSPFNGQAGLDAQYPYLGITNLGILNTDDNPGFDLDGFKDPSTGASVATDYAVNKDLFLDTLMYFAPGSNQPVPLAQFGWDLDGYVQIPSTQAWKLDTTNAGNVIPDTPNVPFNHSNTFPSWYQILPSGMQPWELYQ
jgi:hypothetical protein